jgi:hypothetical protein
MQPVLFYNAVYYVECPTKVLNPIAIRPHISSKEARWEDTSRGTTVRIIKAVIHQTSEKSSPPPRISLTTDKNDVVELSKLTLKIYNEKLKSRTVDRPSFTSDDAVQQYYLKQNFEG